MINRLLIFHLEILLSFCWIYSLGLSPPLVTIVGPTNRRGKKPMIDDLSMSFPQSQLFSTTTIGYF
ncbi:hypothetical protein Syun_011752 [Stephania yunnanensis]|uniref:Uncharacterized protein n=1 Tax=Stephania yunnanensis TaxID=152371 RepID=A0AAP0K0J8_9MAGN